MSKISQTFLRLRANKKKALIPFITAGDPDLRTTEKLIFTLEKNGADLIELGVPFSDPMADGPTIQMASERSLTNKTTLKMIFELVKRVRKKTVIPIILMGYYNPFFIYGLKHLARDARDAGVDGILTVDLPPEEAGGMKFQIERAGLDMIFLLAPTSNDARIKLIVENASGFVYYVSLTGVTGVRSKLAKDIKKQLSAIKRNTALPIGVGFGISNPLHAKLVAKWTDAVVVGSAIIKIIESSRNKEQMLKKVGKFASSLKRAMDESHR
jgi:tryptophan synthase alpha chain